LNAKSSSDFQLFVISFSISTDQFFMSLRFMDIGMGRDLKECWLGLLWKRSCGFLWWLTCMGTRFAGCSLFTIRLSTRLWESFYNWFVFLLYGEKT